LARWSVVSEGSSGSVRGLFVDVLDSVVYVGPIGSLGVIVNPEKKWLAGRVPTGVTIQVANSEPPFLSNHELSFLSTATVLNVRKLQIRKVDDRCAGLCIHHHDGSFETLGEWDPAASNNIRDIYNADTDGDLRCITFYYSELNPDSFSHITNVRVGEYQDQDQGQATFPWHISNRVRIILGAVAVAECFFVASSLTES
jgi:hypothetical protein